MNARPIRIKFVRIEIVSGYMLNGPESRTHKTFPLLSTEHQQPISKFLWQAMEDSGT